MIEKDIILEEYKVLKLEQLERIKIRDNLIYISLGVFGAIFSYAMYSGITNMGDRSLVLLLLPTVSLVLSWVYINNDEKVSHIGKYIRKELTPKIKELLDTDDSIIFGWETYHRSDYKRVTRKAMQVTIDIIAFAMPAVVSIYAYYTLNPDSSGLITALTYWNVGITGLIFILLIGFDYSERKKGL